eukprot:SAG22_NODE_301_length_12744_cov_19.648189_6_plen_484_part_00
MFGNVFLRLTNRLEPGLHIVPVTDEVNEFLAQRSRKSPEKKTPEKTVDIKPGKMELFCGDSLDKLKGMDTDSVDVVVTSPPYNLGIKYDVYGDSKTDDEYLAWINEIAGELRRVVKPDGSVFVNVGFSNTKPLVAMHVAQHFCQHFVMQNQFVWVKSIAIKGETTGNFKPINSSRYVNNTHEFIYHFTADGAQDIDKRSIGVPYTHKGNLERFNHDVDLRCRGNCWFVPYEPINSSAQRGNHPATFPAAIPEMCIKLSGKKAGVVLDPFVGTGTTAIVASNLGFDAIGFDISQQYLDFALKVQTPKKTPQKKALSTYTGASLPIKIEDGVTLKVLELFSGTGSVGKIAEKIRGCQVISVDVHPETAGYYPTVVCDVLKLDYKNLGFIPDLIWASPPCQTYSKFSHKHRTKNEVAADFFGLTGVGMSPVSAPSCAAAARAACCACAALLACSEASIAFWSSASTASSLRDVTYLVSGIAWFRSV